jgi:hypothetical protein
MAIEYAAAWMQPAGRDPHKAKPLPKNAQNIRSSKRPVTTQV